MKTTTTCRTLPATVHLPPHAYQFLPAGPGSFSVITCHHLPAAVSPLDRRNLPAHAVLPAAIIAHCCFLHRYHHTPAGSRLPCILHCLRALNALYLAPPLHTLRVLHRGRGSFAFACLHTAETRCHAFNTRTFAAFLAAHAWTLRAYSEHLLRRAPPYLRAAHTAVRTPCAAFCRARAFVQNSSSQS